MQKKHLGQHFLHDPKLLAKIAAQAPVVPGDLVLEIGPGQGTLTQAILDLGCRVLAVEYDAQLIPFLNNKFAREIAAGKFSLVQGDILEFDTAQIEEHSNLAIRPPHPDPLLSRRGESASPPGPKLKSQIHALRSLSEGESNLSSAYHIIANIPYYITGAILQKFLTAEHQPQSMTLIMQREVADRIMAFDDRGNPGAGKHSLLSLSIWAYGIPTRPFIISAGAFTPPPDVDSAVLVISDISRKNFLNSAAEELFFKLIHAGFAQKRKQLKKMIQDVVSEQLFLAWCHDEEYPATVRAEDVSIAAWLELVQIVGCKN